MAESAATPDRRLEPPPTAAAARPRWIGPTSPRYYVCVAVLAVSALAMQSVATTLGSYFRKLPLPLKRSLYLLDRAALAPRYDLAPVQPPPLSDEVVANLGTTEYLDWHLIDTTRQPRDACYRARVFVTYYSGQPDLVPHNPRECLSAAGFSFANDTLIHVEASDARGEPLSIPVSVLEFEPPRRGVYEAGDGSDGVPRLTVAYFFYANGKYVTTRDQVRVRVASLLDRYAYYSKVEVSFSDASGRRLATREQTIEAVQPLLARLLPALLRDHFQDWEAIQAGQPPVTSSP